MWKKLLIISIIFLIGITVACTKDDKTTNGSNITTINYYGKPDTDFERKVVEDFEKEYPHIKVNYVELAGGSNEKLTTIQTVLQSRDSTIDVFAADATWPPIFIAAGWVAPLNNILQEDIEKGLLDEYVQSALSVFQNRGITYGLPYISNAGTFYYRTDLLEKYNQPIPKTWQEVVDTAIYILEQENDSNLIGFSSAWKQTEGLTATVMEHFWDQGVYIYKDNAVDLDEEKIEAALQIMYDMLYVNGVTIKATPTFGNSDVREIMQSGNLIFSRDWISQAGKFMDSEINKVADHMGIASVPGGNALGVWGLMISEFSKNKEEAALFLKYRTRKQAQIEQAAAINQLPAVIEAFEDPAVIEAFPAAQDLLIVMNDGEPRPLSPFYGEISSIIQLEVHSMLINKSTPEKAAKNIVRRINEVLK